LHFVQKFYLFRSKYLQELSFEKENRFSHQSKMNLKTSIWIVKIEKRF